MRIVVLDGYTLNPGDLSWNELQKLGECTIYDRTGAGEVISRGEEADIILTNKTIISREQIQQLVRLKYIGVLATGYNIADVLAAREKGIPVSNVPTYGTKSVAQMTFALLLELTQHVGHHAETVRSGRWNKSPDFCYWDYPLIELNDLVMGIIGYGRIGQAVATIASAFGMQLLVHSRNYSRLTGADIQPAELSRLLQASDVVSLHCPLDSKTRHIVNADALRQMKPSAFLLNTSRGDLVNEADLAAALNEDQIAGAGLDVLSVEPPVATNPLLSAKNCLITPHIAWATRAARERLMKAAVENVRAFLAGAPQNVVN